ncbi:UBA-e1-C domain-containing protein [Mycena sanguinolenta]|uniref:UBA-e1-C domain-containing protein n=1 Tax=Mycena sanguinolenta TaxID=230812 RepID=A0A8H7DJ96_9AGAR|nr:UBA-e1-C domain-containing protein [Mycena sanguinolenta]
MSYSYSSSSSSTDQDTTSLVQLVIGNLIPLHVVLVGLTWVIHDYLITLEDEIRYVWPQRLNFSKFMFLWIRYYTIVLLLFDVVQIHVFARPGITSNNLCVAMDTIIRVVGAVSLWSVEIVMQLRVYALYNCSRRVAVVNCILFAGSIVGFLVILIYNHSRRAAIIASAIHLDLPGCPTVHSGLEWAQWVPATIYEGILFGFALVKTFEKTISTLRKDGTLSLHTILLRDNILYFFGIALLLLFNNLMVVNLTHIPWFSYGPFHAAVGIMTCRMVINLRKASSKDVMISLNSSVLHRAIDDPSLLEGAARARPDEDLPDLSPSPSTNAALELMV